MASSTLTSKGQITLPERIREHLALSPGDRVDFVVDAEGEVRVRKSGGSIARQGGRVAPEPRDWLSRLPRREGVVAGDPNDLVAIDWSAHWDPGPGVNAGQLPR